MEPTRSICFVWGRGGVGKSHIVLGDAVQSPKPCMILTMDPSQRLLHLVERPAEGARIVLANQEINIKVLEADRLFAELAAKTPASPRLKHFYDLMCRGLQDFREYLLLIQLSDEIERSQNCRLIIDTPPFQEAVGLHRKSVLLKNFFGTQLAQLSLKSTRWLSLASPLKKVFEFSQVFVGKRTTEQVLELIEWMLAHTERFQTAAQHLETLFFSRMTEHHLVLTPESPPEFLNEVHEFFAPAHKVRFCINRSLRGFECENSSTHPFMRELRSLAQKEQSLVREIQSRFSAPQLQFVPWRAMGDDTAEELLEFVRYF